MAEKSTSVKTPLARLAFAQGLFKTQANVNGRMQWQCTLLLKKDSDMTAIRNAIIEAAVAEWGDKAVAQLKAETIKNPILDGDGKQGKSKKTGEPHPGFSGHWFIRCQSGEEYRPKLVDRKRNPVTEKSEMYSGCYVYAIINAFAWERPEQGKGVSFNVSAVQFAKDGENLGGDGVDTDKAFDVIEDEGEAPKETKKGKGAAGFFG